MTNAKIQNYINILGYRMHYKVLGNGKPIILIHGFGTDGYSWRNNIPALSKHFRLCAPDLIGFGLSDKPCIEYSRSFFTKQIYQFLQSLKIGKTTLIGASWGGAIAFTFTLEFPKKVNKLIVIDSLTPFPTGRLIKARKRRLRALTAINQGRMSFKLGKRVLEDLLKESYYNKEAVTNRVVSEQFKMWKTNKGRTALIAVGEQCKFDNIVDKIDKIHNKTLIIWGEKDPYFPLKSAYWLQGKIKNSKLIIIPDAGHAPHETHPDIVNQVILGFLEK